MRNERQTDQEFNNSQKQLPIRVELLSEKGIVFSALNKVQHSGGARQAEQPEQLRPMESKLGTERATEKEALEDKTEQYLDV